MAQVVEIQADDVTEQASTQDRAPRSRGPAAVRRLGAEVAKFGTVGAMAFVIDVGLFNLLRAGLLEDSPLTAKTISVVAATAFAFLANRHWTYRDRARTGRPPCSSRRTPPRC